MDIKLSSSNKAELTAEPGDIVCIDGTYYLFATIKSQECILVNIFGTSYWDEPGTERKIVEQIRQEQEKYEVTVYSKNDFALNIINK